MWVGWVVAYECGWVVAYECAIRVRCVGWLVHSSRVGQNVYRWRILQIIPEVKTVYTL
jgi:hypothetical protein